MEKEPEINFLCDTCGRLIGSERHQQECNTKFDINCPKCDKTFTSLKNLRQHMNVHNENKHECTYCSKTFSFKCNLTRHINLIHLKNTKKSWKCSICDTLFQTKWNLIEHNKIHSSRMFFCINCEKSFYRKRHLINHSKFCNP